MTFYTVQFLCGLKQIVKYVDRNHKVFFGLLNRRGTKYNTKVILLYYVLLTKTLKIIIQDDSE